MSIGISCIYMYTGSSKYEALFFLSFLFFTACLFLSLIIISNRKLHFRMWSQHHRLNFYWCNRVYPLVWWPHVDLMRSNVVPTALVRLDRLTLILASIGTVVLVHCESWNDKRYCHCFSIIAVTSIPGYRRRCAVRTPSVRTSMALSIDTFNEIVQYIQTIQITITCQNWLTLIVFEALTLESCSIAKRVPKSLIHRGMLFQSLVHGHNASWMYRCQIFCEIYVYVGFYTYLLRVWVGYAIVYMPRPTCVWMMCVRMHKKWRKTNNFHITITITITIIISKYDNTTSMCSNVLLSPYGVAACISYLNVRLRTCICVW